MKDLPRERFAVLLFNRGRLRLLAHELEFAGERPAWLDDALDAGAPPSQTRRARSSMF